MSSRGSCPDPSSAGVTSYAAPAGGAVAWGCSGSGADVGQDEGGVPKRGSAVELYLLLWFGEGVVREADECTKEGRILQHFCTTCRDRETDKERDSQRC